MSEKETSSTQRSPTL